MALIDLLTNPDTFNVGIQTGTDENGQPIIIPNYNIAYSARGGSKQLKYPQYNPGGSSGGPLLGSRVEFDLSNENADPTFLIGENHNNGNIQDFIYRGGFDAFQDRVRIDTDRINAFLEDRGGLFGLGGNRFLQRQAALQLLNPQSNTRTFNDGLSLRAQIGSGGQTRFKRHGLLPEPADINANNALGNLFGNSGLGNLVSNAIGGDYVTLFQQGIGENRRDETRENNYGLGDPGRPIQGVFGDILGAVLGENPFKKKRAYNVSLKKTKRSNNLDLINFQKIIKTDDGALNQSLKGIKDFIPFRFEVVDSDNTSATSSIIFRAFIDSYSDNLSATHNEIKYNGRGEPFYTYNKFGRDIQIGFKIAAQSRHEMKPIYQKLNFLMAQTAPNYSSTGRIRTPYMKLTMGDYFHRIPGVLASCNISWQKDYPWEIKLDSEKDKEMLILPHVLDVSISFKPIHGFTPNNSPTDAPFIGIGRRPGKTVLEEWLGPDTVKDYSTPLNSTETQTQEESSNSSESSDEENQMGPFQEETPPGTFEPGGAYDEYMSGQ